MKKENNFNFYFLTSLWCLKKFYESLMHGVESVKKVIFTVSFLQKKTSNLFLEDLLKGIWAVDEELSYTLFVAPTWFYYSSSKKYSKHPR